MGHTCAAPLQQIHPQSLGVQRDGQHLRTVVGQDAGGLPVSGVLHGVAPLPAQELGQQAGQVFRPGAHHNLLRLGLDTAEVSQVADDGLPQLLHPLGVTGGQKATVLLRQNLPHESGPGGEGEAGGVYRIGGKIILNAFFLYRRSGGRRSWDSGWGGLRFEGLDKKAAFGLRAQIALRQELAIGPLYGHYADLQMGGQGPLGGEPFTGSQGPLFDFVPNTAVELFIKRLGAVWFQRDGEHESPPI